MFAAQPSEVEVLRAENAGLRERIAVLERDAGAGLVFPAAWCLTAKEQRLLGALLTRPRVSRDGLLTALYFDYLEEPDPDTLDSHYCKLRRKLRVIGFDVPAKRRYLDYELGEPLRAELRRLSEAPDGSARDARS